MSTVRRKLDWGVGEYRYISVMRVSWCVACVLIALLVHVSPSHSPSLSCAHGAQLDKGLCNTPEEHELIHSHARHERTNQNESHEINSYQNTKADGNFAVGHWRGGAGWGRTAHTQTEIARQALPLVCVGLRKDNAIEKHIVSVL